MRTLKVLALITVTALLGACASGPKYAEVQASQPQLAEGKGRVFFYRTQLVGAAVQPTIFVDGQGVGTCEPDGVFYRDLAPGSYVANVETEVERSLSFVLAAGETKYVRCYISIGLLIGRGNLELVAETTGKSEISGLSYTGGS